jgi:hypothetical protein
VRGVPPASSSLRYWKLPKALVAVKFISLKKRLMKINDQLLVIRMDNLRFIVFFFSKHAVAKEN